MRRILIAIAVLASVSGCGSSSGKSSASVTGSGSGSGGVCHQVSVPPPPGPQHLAAPTIRLDARRTYTVSVITNCGKFAFALDVRRFPQTSASFYSLVKRGFFDGLTFHRVAAGFVIQGGDPNGDGSGGPGYTIVEPPASGTRYVQGDVAMAKTATDPRGASGSQFFVVTAANATQSAGLTSDYALLGKVVAGQSVVNAIGSLPTNPAGDGMPSPAVVMSKVTVAAS